MQGRRRDGGQVQAARVLVARVSAVADDLDPDRSRRLEHVAEMQRNVEKGPLPEEVLAEIEARFAAVGRDWSGMI